MIRAVKPCDEAEPWSLRRVLAGIQPHVPALIFFILLTIVTFADIPSHSFLVVWDDPGYITANADIRGVNWQNLHSAFTHTYVGNYAPVQIVSYMIDYQLWGLHPLGFLITNISIHLISVMTFYMLMIRLELTRWAAVFGGAIFLLHPVQVENVLWISQRKSVLAMMFFLLAFHGYLNYTEKEERHRQAWYVASIVLYLLAVLSKSISIIFPFALILYDHLYHRVPRRITAHTNKIPYLLISLIIGAATVMIQTPESVGGRIEYPSNFIQALPLTMIPVLVRYMRMIFWPDPEQLSIIYTIPWSKTIDARFAIAAAVIPLLIIITLYLYRRSHKLLFWYSLIFLGLVPVSQIIPLVTKMNDRYLYFPMLGVATLCAYAAMSMTACSRPRSVKTIVIFCMVGIIAVLSIASYQRSLVWRSTVTLFSDAAAKSPHQYAPWAGLATGYRAIGDIESALHYYEIAIRYGYLDADDAFSIARIYLDRKDAAKAYSYILGGIMKSNNPEGILLLGKYLIIAGSFDEAEKQLLKYLEFSRDSAEGLAEIGKMYLLKGNIQRAKYYAEKTLLVDTRFSEPYIIKACVAATEGEVSRSIGFLSDAVQHGFTDWQQLNDLGCLATVQRDPRFKKLMEL